MVKDNRPREQKRRPFRATTTTITNPTITNPTITNPEAVCGCPQPGPETIQVEQVLGAAEAQKVVEFDMVVPAAKPDIEQVIDVYVKNMEINNIDVIANKVIVRGDFEVKVMYVAADNTQSVHAFEKRNVRWTRDISIPGTMPNMDATADVAVEYVDYDHYCDDRTPRQVHITVVIKVWARVVSIADMDVWALNGQPVNEATLAGVPAGVPLAYGSTTEMTGTQYSTYGDTTNYSDNVAASSMGQDTASASATGGGNINAFGPYNAFVTGYNPESMTVTGPGITPIAKTPLAVSGTATVSGTVVNIRTGPGTTFPVVTKVKQGDTVTITDQAFGWYKVTLKDGKTTGWLASWLIGAPSNPKG